ncbi:TPA: hypothetical protein LUY02_004752 [Enterobacter hormaechei subsp. hoffmannii]|nr:hypothetical protein [Enterobacter hormaechei subsp. hoffmannii]
MPKQNTPLENKNTPKTYDSCDLLDAHELAQSDLSWMHTAIFHIRKEVQRIHNLSKQGEIITQYHLSEMIEHLHMYEYLAENRMSHHQGRAAVYEKEWKAQGGDK